MLLSAFLFTQFLNAQNLVPNPSFEDTVACPTFYQVDYSIGWSSYSQSPDYYHSCASHVPSNFFGFQYPRTGDAYVGLETYNRGGGQIREYIGIQLNQPLTIGQRYVASFYVSKAQINLTIATNKIGLHFSTVSFSQVDPEPIDNNSLVYTDSIIEDTLNWVHISGSFIADSSYSFMSIGNFFADTLTSFIAYDSSAIYSYYYIDDVSLYASSDSESVVEQDNFPSIKIFPNPARDQIFIEGYNVKSISIYTVSGSIFYEGKNANCEAMKIDISNLPRGVCFIEVQIGQAILIKKIILN